MPHYLICYDISDPKRLSRVHRKMLKKAMFVQYSVYYLNGTATKLHSLLSDMSRDINHHEDDIRAYPIEPLDHAITLGQTWLPNGVLIR